jgi:hypothetical protein
LGAFTPDGKAKYVELKTTRGTTQTPFYMSANEGWFSKQHPNNYYLYRVYVYEDISNSGRFYDVVGTIEEAFDLCPTQYRAVRSWTTQPTHER